MIKRRTLARTSRKPVLTADITPFEGEWLQRAELNGVAARRKVEAWAVGRYEQDLHLAEGWHDSPAFNAAGFTGPLAAGRLYGVTRPRSGNWIVNLRTSDRGAIRRDASHSENAAIGKHDGCELSATDVHASRWSP